MKAQKSIRLRRKNDNTNPMSVNTGYRRINLNNFVSPLFKAKITTKGQVTIPIQVRKALDLNEGDQLVFDVKGNEASVRKLTIIDRLAVSVGTQLRKEFPTPKEFDEYLNKNRKSLFEKIYGIENVKDSN